MIKEIIAVIPFDHILISLPIHQKNSTSISWVIPIASMNKKKIINGLYDFNSLFFTIKGQRIKGIARKQRPTITLEIAGNHSVTKAWETAISARL
jgi:hypothetical protein